MSHDPHDGMSPSARALLRHGAAPRLRTASERERTAAAVHRIAATPAIAASVWFGWKGAALATALVLGGVALVKSRHVEAPPPRVAHVAPSVSRPIAPRAPTPTVEPATGPTVSVTAPPPARVVAPARAVAPHETAFPRAPRVVVHEAPSATVEPSDGVSASAAPVPVRLDPPPEDEPRALERARASLSTDPAEALRIVESGAASERFAEERALIAMEAERRLGRTDSLHARAEAFLRRFPRSLYAERVRRWVAP